MIEGFLFTSALKDFMRAKRLWPWLALAVFGFAVAWAWKSYSVAEPRTEIYGQVTFIIVFKLLALASAVFSTAVVGQEVEQKTIVYLLTRPVQRWKLLLMRYLASAVVVALIGIVSALGVSIAVYGMGALTQPLFLRDCAALAMGALAYGALFTLVSLWLNKALVVCLLFAFGWETMVPNMPGDAYHMSIFSYLQAIAEHPANAPDRNALNLLAGQAGTNLISPSVAWPTMFLMIATCMGIAMWWFSAFEYVPREDAG